MIDQDLDYTCSVNIVFIIVGKECQNLHLKSQICILTIV